MEGMTAPEDLHHQAEALKLEVSGFHERLQFARDEGDHDHAAAMEQEMNESLEDLGDLLRALGSSALHE